MPVLVDTSQARQGFTIAVKYDPAVLQLVTVEGPGGRRPSVDLTGTVCEAVEWADGRCLPDEGRFYWSVLTDLTSPAQAVIPAGKGQVLVKLYFDDMILVYRFPRPIGLSEHTEAIISAFREGAFLYHLQTTGRDRPQQGDPYEESLGLLSQQSRRDSSLKRFPSHANPSRGSDGHEARKAFESPIPQDRFEEIHEIENAFFVWSQDKDPGVRTRRKGTEIAETLVRGDEETTLRTHLEPEYGVLQSIPRLPSDRRHRVTVLLDGFPNPVGQVLINLDRKHQVTRVLCAASAA